VSRPESLDRKLLAAAFARARELLDGPSVRQSEALQLEQSLRPLASASEIQQVVVPLLDRAELFGLAMAWDSGTDNKSEPWLLARVGRWLQLRAAEFGFITLSELNRSGDGHDDARQRLANMLDEERPLRRAMYTTNLDAIGEVDAELFNQLNKSHRTTVAMRPIGAGLAEFAGPGQPWVQLWAVTPNQALVDADALMRRVSKQDDAFIAGVGDCTLPAAAARLRLDAMQRMHVVELHIARVRALLELVDLSEAVRQRRVQLHVGPRAIETLGPFARKAFQDVNALIGGDPMAIALLRAGAGLDQAE
jgi:hypothetical protein